MIKYNHNIINVEPGYKKILNELKEFLATNDFDGLFVKLRSSLNGPLLQDCPYLINDIISYITQILVQYCGFDLSQVSQIFPYMFYGSSVDNVEIPKNINIIGYLAFCKSKLKHVDIEEGVKVIETHSFYGCRYLTGNIRIPRSVTSIGESVLGDCPNIKAVYIPQSMYTQPSNIFTNYHFAEKHLVNCSCDELVRYCLALHPSIPIIKYY